MANNSMTKYPLARSLVIILTCLFSMHFISANDKSNSKLIQNSSKGKILIVMTNHSKYPSRKDTTGLWVAELTHFYDVADKAGYDMDFVSPKGGMVPLDSCSQKWFYLDKKANSYLSNKIFMSRLNHTLKPSEVKASDYKAIYFTGGHGVMWDYPDNPELTALGEKIYQQGGIISAVCHGVAGLLALQDESGRPLISNQIITGFSNLEETLSGMQNQVPFSLEDNIKSKNAHYKKGLFPFTSYVVKDGRIITGQNPQSSQEIGKSVILQLNKSN